MTQPIDLAERQALATPRDWPQDFAADHGWQVCDWCLRLFLGATPRIRCRECETLHGR
jgi:hypothetical protein